MVPKWIVCESCSSRFLPLKTELIIVTALGPDNLIRAMAHVPLGVAKATMVSSFTEIMKCKDRS